MDSKLSVITTWGALTKPLYAFPRRAWEQNENKNTLCSLRSFFKSYLTASKVINSCHRGLTLAVGCAVDGSSGQ